MVRLLRQGSRRFTGDFASIVIVAGLANALLLAIINVAAENASNAEENGRYLWLFTIVLIGFILAQRHILMTSAHEIERILHRIRVSISDRVSRADLFMLESIGRSAIYASITRETVTISQAASTLVIACQSASMIVFSTLYLAWLSRTAFALTLALTVTGLMMHFRKADELNLLLLDANAQENRFFDRVTDLLDGFKEVKLSQRRSAALFDRLRTMSVSLTDVKIKSATGFAEHHLFAQAAFYLLIGGIVFLLPQLAPTFPPVVMKATAAVLFIVGPLTSLAGAIPIFTRANIAAANLAALEIALDRSAAPEAPAVDRPVGAFQMLVLRNVTFHYADVQGGESFAIGPVSLSLRSGEVVFVIGGNGSGKSTFLKVLTGLYRPEKGAIMLGRTTISPADASWYREHFSAVLSDYHLFDELFGLDHVKKERVDDLLRQMDLDRKTQFVDGRFSTVDLSAGQKKRLALIVSILEDRPIMVFDEWAADQDPAFRRYFYEDVLPSLRRQGKTVVAVTHDDRYFSAADRVLKMEYGQFVEGAAV